jgi:hypothetical protein
MPSQELPERPFHTVYQEVTKGDPYMTLDPKKSLDEHLLNPQDFSLVQGGPLFQVLRRAHLYGDGLTLLHRRVVAISLFAWLPLLVFSALGGELVGGDIAIPFLKDVDVQVKFLVVIPLLIIAELVVHQFLRPLVTQFLKQGLISDSDRPRFDAYVASALRLRNSLLAEIIILAVVYGLGVLVLWRHYSLLETTTWYGTPSAGGSTLTLTGMWYGFVSLPIFQFLAFRWIYRLLIWARLLFQISRLDLNMLPTHPDRVGGLGFLSNVLYAFLPLAVAFGALISGNLANRILYAGAKLPEFKVQIGAAVVFLILIFVGPLLVFGGRIAAVKRKGLLDYGALAQRYVRDFDAKWLRGGGSPGDSPLGSEDIQSLADMGNSFEVVRTMRMVPVAVRDVGLVAVAVLAPIAPLMLTVMPIDQLLRLAFGLLR